MHASSLAGTEVERGKAGGRAHMKAEDGGGGGLGRIQLAAVDGIDNGTCVAQLDSRAHTVAPTCPPACSHAMTQSTSTCILVPQTAQKTKAQ